MCSSDLTNRGQKRHQSIVDNAALFASRTLAAGMMSGMTSPARPWFKLGLADKDLAKKPDVQAWLYKAGEVMQAVFNHSNTYRALHMIYEELGLFGTAATVIVPNFDNVLHHYPMTIGEYALGIDFTGRPNAIAREYQMTVGQLIGQFGAKNCSSMVVNAYDRNNLDQMVPVIHLIEERVGRDTTKLDAVPNRPSSS